MSMTTLMALAARALFGTAGTMGCGGFVPKEGRQDR